MSTYNPELQLTLDALKKLVQDRIAEGKKGIVLGKGTSKEQKIRFTQLLYNVTELETYFNHQGNFTIGSCTNCKEYHPEYSSDYMRDGDPFFGLCGSNGVHAWHTCKRFRRRS